MEHSNIPSDKRAFHCDHCGGRILIPRDLPPTTGPCPHCSGVITSPPPAEPPAPLSAAPVPPAQAIAPPPAQAVTPPPAQAASPPPAQAASPPSAQAIATPPVKTSIPPPRGERPPQENPAPRAETAPPSKPVPAPSPEAAHATERAQQGKRAGKSAASNKESPQKSGLIPVMLVLLVLILGAGVAIHFLTKEMGNNIPPPSTVKAAADPSVMEANYIRIGWQKDAYQVLRNYMAATTGEEKLPYILNADTLAPRIEDFYGGGLIDDSDTPADAFSVYELSEEDRRRGLFMMVFDQPPQFDMKEFFRPLASLEVQYGIDEADLLLSTLARVGNFALDPIRVHAFFKRTPEGLKLDWEIFAQTKYRTFQNFVELPETGQTAVFRVFIVEDVPDKSHTESGTRTYRMADSANTTDTARVNVKVDSEIGRELSRINWRGAKESRPVTRTATVELSWTGETSSPELEISRFICWEFLGLGGKETPSTVSKN